MVDPDPEEPEPQKPGPWADVSRVVPKKVRDKGEIATARWGYLFAEESKLSNEYAERYTSYVALVKRLSKAKPGQDADETAAEKAVNEGFIDLRALGANIYELHEERMALQGDR